MSDLFEKLYNDVIVQMFTSRGSIRRTEETLIRTLLSYFQCYFYQSNVSLNLTVYIGNEGHVDDINKLLVRLSQTLFFLYRLTHF